MSAIRIAPVLGREDERTGDLHIVAVFLWFKLLWGCYRYIHVYTVYSYTHNTVDSEPNLHELPQPQRVYINLTTGLKDPESAGRIPVAHSLKKISKAARVAGCGEENALLMYSVSTYAEYK